MILLITTIVCLSLFFTVNVRVLPAVWTPCLHKLNNQFGGQLQSSDIQLTE